MPAPAKDLLAATASATRTANVPREAMVTVDAPRAPALARASLAEETASATLTASAPRVEMVDVDAPKELVHVRDRLVEPASAIPAVSVQAKDTAVDALRATALVKDPLVATASAIPTASALRKAVADAPRVTVLARPHPRLRVEAAVLPNASATPIANALRPDMEVAAVPRELVLARDIQEQPAIATSTVSAPKVVMAAAAPRATALVKVPMEEIANATRIASALRRPAVDVPKVPVPARASLGKVEGSKFLFLCSRSNMRKIRLRLTRPS